ncbi:MULTISPECIES: glycerate kinase [unclassified Microbacterium]|mgnify:CR=1 FL=1|uniref:glycerate kinase n=1 Tax=unclassified Microbacterium TaxID=2609290 RepID=UPI001AC0E865|nr:glycerate kinase [Microbacterium sp.]MBN9157007.1 glycerate kinase [Microbacterium sp.]MBS1899918.1 glycerate kinase [Actinomycetota bacterium]
MRILIASDKFKGSATGPQVASALAEGILAVAPDVAIDAVPVADGGEGTVDAALAAGFEEVTATVTGPTGQPVQARFGVRGTQAIIEMAAASGLDQLPGGVKDALGATSRGTGELIAAALDHGATSIVLGIGGSANTDGGAGMLQALGVSLRDAEGQELPGGGGALSRIAEADVSGLDPRLADVEIVLASDVDNPLLGERGAPAVFGPQKGASPDDVAALDAALARYSALLERQPGIRAATELPGAGGAGGVGYAALAALGARREPGVEVVQRLTGLAEALVGADLVITGEGSLDDQSLGGKTPLGVAAASRAAGIGVIAVCGRSTLSAEAARAAGFERVYALAELEPDPARSMAEAVALLTEVGRRIGAELGELVPQR